MAVAYGWQRLLTHDGRALVDLTLRADSWVRHLQSGYRAGWRPVAWASPDPMEGPLTIEGAASVAPGGTARVSVFPLDPRQWQGVRADDVLEMLDLRGRVLGTARVVDLVDVPEEAPPARIDGSVRGTPLVAPTRRRRLPFSRER